MRTRQAMEELRALLQQIVAQNRPDFFRIGFYQYKNPNADLSDQPIEKINADTLKYLDDNFMLEFVAMEEKGVAHSYNTALEAKKQVLAELEKEGAEGTRPSHHRFSEEPVQLTMDTVDGEVLQKLRSLDVNALTPIQCMNTLFELCSMLK